MTNNLNVCGYGYLVSISGIVLSAKAVIRRVLRVCQDWIESVAAEVVRTKQLLYQSLSPIIQTTLAIFSVYISQTGRHKFGTYENVGMPPKR